MPAKLVTKDIQSYIPKCCRKDEHPLTVFYKTLTKRSRDDYMTSLYTEEDGKDGETEYKPHVSLSFAFERFLEQSLCVKNKVFILNARESGKHITKKGEAIVFLLDELNPDISDEIEEHMREQSTLSGEEGKN